VDEPTVVVGIVTRAHGIRGEVAIQVRSDNPDRWRTGSVVFDEGGDRFSIRAARGSGSRLFVRFEGVDDRTAADALRGRTFVVPVSWLPPLPDGEYWPHQLEGAEVLTESGHNLGILTDVVANPANDLWVAVDADGNETLVPAISEVVREVDLEGKRVVVADLPGLTSPDDA
jgi:16S rRNA processing protein RimM